MERRLAASAGAEGSKRQHDADRPQRGRGGIARRLVAAPARRRAGARGNVLAAWRRLASRPLPPDVEDLKAVAGLLGVGWSDGLGELIDAARDAMRKGASAPVVAARIVFFTELPRNAYRRRWSQIPTRLAWRVLSWMEDRGPKRNISADGNLSPNPQILIKDLIENGFRAVEA